MQFVQICLRLSGTYRFPLPPLTIEFLSYIKFLEVKIGGKKMCAYNLILNCVQVFDIAQIPMNLDCWQHFNYINKVYVHTLTCLSIMALLKPGAVLSFAMLPVALTRRLYKQLTWSAGRAEADGPSL